jgi:hypothetical protein
MIWNEVTGEWTAGSHSDLDANNCDDCESFDSNNNKHVLASSKKPHIKHPHIGPSSKK